MISYASTTANIHLSAQARHADLAEQAMIARNAATLAARAAERVTPVVTSDARPAIPAPRRIFGRLVRRTA